MTDSNDQLFTGLCLVVTKSGRTGYTVVEVMSNGELDSDNQSSITTITESIRDASDRIQDWDRERSELERRQAEEERGNNVIDVGRGWWRRA